MKKQFSFVLSTIIGLGICASAPLAVNANTTLSSDVSVLQVAATGGTVRMYHGTRLRYYPNHVIVADTYNREVVQHIAGLCRELGWDVVYLQVPEDLREYTNTYFVDYGVGVNYFAVDVNPDDTLGMFYGTRGYPGYHGYHNGDHRDHREHRHEHHHNHDHHDKHHNKNHKGHGKSQHKGEQHKMHHHNGEHHGNGHRHGGHGEHHGHGGHGGHRGHGGHGGHGHR